MLIITLVLGSAVFAIGTELPAAPVRNSFVFTGEEINLSLDEARTMMLTSGAAIERARFNQRTNNAVTRQSFEAYMAVFAPEAVETAFGERTPRGARELREATDFALVFNREQSSRNFDAEVNNIVRDVVQSYFSMAHAGEALRISNENVAIHERLYLNTRRSFELGAVSRQDLLRAGVGLNEARINAWRAEDTFANARMGFNIAFGYDLMQNITLTDSLEQASAPDISLEEAIDMALENRNDIHEAGFRLRFAEIMVEHSNRHYSRFSATHLTREANLMGAQTAMEAAPKTVEMDVRQRYMEMNQKRADVELGRLNVENAREAHRLANLQFEVGMMTLTDVQQAQHTAFQAELGFYRTLLEYNLAIIDFEQSTTVGTNTILITAPRI